MEQEPTKDEYEHFDKMNSSLIAAFDWVLGKDYLKSEFIQRSIREDYEKPENEDETEETFATSRVDTIDEIIRYATDNKIPMHMAEDAYELAHEEN